MAWIPIVSPYRSSEPLELGTPTCLVPKHLQIRKVEHPKHNAFQRFRRDLRSTSGRLEFIWEPMLFLLPSCVAAGWIYVYIYRHKYTERKINTVETVEPWSHVVHVHCMRYHSSRQILISLPVHVGYQSAYYCVSPPVHENGYQLERVKFKEIPQI